MKMLKTVAILLFIGISTNGSAKEIKFFKPKPEPVVPYEEKLPIVFHPDYDIGFFGIEKLHSFDPKKYGKVAHHLIEKLNKSKGHFHQPKSEVSTDDLTKIHAQTYLNSLNSSQEIAQITEVIPLAWIPNFLLQRNLLKPMCLATQGTIDAAQLALKDGVGINLGGGYHHAKSESGGGFCVYADIPLAIKKLREDNPTLKVLYIDLDAHQGNGVEECLEYDKDTYIFDCYNENNYPRDLSATLRIDKAMNSNAIYCKECRSLRGVRRQIIYETYKKRRLGCEDCNQAYLENLKKYIGQTLQEFKQLHGKDPDIIFYNAGTDCFEEDPLGRMRLTKQGIIDRDQFIFEQAKENTIPICMTLSGGYSPRSAEIIGDSIVNLWEKQLLEKRVN